MDPLSQFDVLVPTFQKLAANTSTDQLDDATPCAEWKVRDLFAHLIGGATAFAAVVRGDTPPSEEIEVADAAIPTTANTAIADLDSAFRLPDALERTISTPFGEMPGDAFARFLAFDLLMHSWDLATATNQPIDVPDDVVHAVSEFARAAVSDDLRGPQTFGPAVAGPPGASDLDSLVAFSGRSR